MRRVLLTTILACAVSTAAFSDALLQRAAESERTGDLDASASQFGEWLSANPGAAGAAEVFDSYLRVEQDFPKLLQTATGFLKTARGVPGAAMRFERIARLYDLAGRIEEARDAYLAAHGEGAGDSTLVAAFLLSLRMNDMEAMSAALQRLTTRSTGSEILLKALSDLRKGARADARAALMGLAEQTGDPDLALKSLWVLYASAQGAGDSSGQSDARLKMAKRFASAPETVLAGGAAAAGTASRRQVVLPTPAPDSLAAPDGVPAATPQSVSPAAPPAAAPAATPAAPVQAPPVSPPQAPAAADAATVSAQPQPASPAQGAPPAQAPTVPAASGGPRYSVQAGSFQMKENADDLVSELGRRGFSATVLHDTSQGKDRWRVFAGSALERDAAEAVRRKLSAAGFLGFLIADKPQ
jgi:cell division septation protein DedD